MTRDFDSLGETWRAQAPRTDAPPEVESVRERARVMARTVRRRDWLETGTALAMLPIFAWVAFTTPHRVSAIGAAIIALSCVLIPVRLRLARRAPADVSLPMVQALRAELYNVRAQERLLRSVVWWYAGPLCLGILMFTFGSPISTTFKLVYGTLVVVLFAGLVRMNATAARQQLEPLARDIESWLAGLEDFNTGQINAH